MSANIFREIFKSEYNLSFKRRHTDTCRTCDENVIGMKGLLVKPARKVELALNQVQHIALKDKTNLEFSNDVKRAKESKQKLRVLTFDLQKTLETPSISTSVAYYKRQLWTYNLCIYDEGEARAYMYVWSEDVASRGGQEIGSCLIKHLKNYASNVTEIILYSDSCGGQNCYIKVAMILKKYLHDLITDESLQIITQKFFVSGHSYNSCDRCFGIIEKKRKKCSGIYTPSDWVNLIQNSKKSEPKYNVIVMVKNDFISSVELESIIVNRKKNVNKEKINWFDFRSLIYRKDEPYIINVVCEDEIEQKISIKHKKLPDESLKNCNLPIL